MYKAVNKGVEKKALAGKLLEPFLFSFDQLNSFISSLDVNLSPCFLKA